MTAACALSTEALDGLPVFTMTDQPETCPHCGRRSNFDELSDGRQVHQCLGAQCGFQWIAEEPDDDVEEE
ncbi:MAG: hypothetical protein E6R08_10180 [Nevskiaceae bacterium]|nr:MAG: hypothetical protein E6R08_10180 [Nevskiaceae bacterium]